MRIYTGLWIRWILRRQCTIGVPNAKDNVQSALHHVTPEIE